MNFIYTVKKHGPLFLCLCGYIYICDILCSLWYTFGILVCTFAMGTDIAIHAILYL